MGKDGKQDAFLKLAAGLLGVGYDELKQRDARRRQQRAVLMTSISMLLMAVFAVISVVAVRASYRAEASQQTAEEQRDQAEAARADADCRAGARSRNPGAAIG